VEPAPERPPVDPAKIYAIERPHPRLLWQFMIFALMGAAAFPIAALILYFRYHTLRYKFDAEGVSISYGVLFRREAFVTYARIQDIHVRRNVVERWLDLGTVEIETAAGSGGGPEVIAGLVEYEDVRDFLYSRMRGAAAHGKPASPSDAAQLELLREIRDALRETRASFERGNA
jgi:putative membrane protein